jgi:hypothetical protein
MPKTLFISHSTQDDAVVDQLADALEAAGFSTWVDHRNGIKPGDASWDAAIRKAITDADAGLFVMSSRSLGSTICAAECLLVRELDDPLYVLRLEAVPPETIWLYIKMIQYADISSDLHTGTQVLIRASCGESGEGLPAALRTRFTGRETLLQYLP